MLRDRVVMGVRDSRTQQALLKKSGLSLTQAIDIALAEEAASRDSKLISAGDEQRPPTESGRLEAIRAATEADPVLTTVIRQLQLGWPDDRRRLPASLRAFHHLRGELASEDGLLYKGRCLPIGDRRPAPANLPALCPELRARLAAEGIEQVFLVQVTVLPELLAASESPLPPADLCVSAPAGRGTTLAFVLPVVQARRRPPGARASCASVLPTQALPAQVPAVFRQYDADTPLCVRLLGGDTVARGGANWWRFTTPAELSESFNVVAPQPLKPLVMHHLLRQPDWRRSLVLVNWNEVAHQLELPLSVLGARVTEFCGVVPACRRRRALGEMAALVCSRL
ncbi:ATP-dependent RNA helicase DDX51 [Amphibalanus amphitrite]|uniref:ATP-dependent RNA helicase n=1 Tax=Amphibalanus amphitrite TaxID=1232801 RepID=A0A6A4WWG3_AMPAM|nr:ATP-dependent RNA helicase DDX51 [Amphibalanus amphitrite]